jgi:hypothetical protein
MTRSGEQIPASRMAVENSGDTLEQITQSSPVC